MKFEIFCLKKDSSENKYTLYKEQLDYLASCLFEDFVHELEIELNSKIKKFILTGE